MTATAADLARSHGDSRPAPTTLNRLFFDAVEKHDRPNALQVKQGGAYQPLSHRTIADRARRVALGLRAIGVARGDRVSILSENRPEWAIADYGCLTAGVTNVPLYPTLPAEQMAFILRDSGAVAIFVSNTEQALKIASVRAELPALRHLIGFGSGALPGAELSLEELEAKGAALETPDTMSAYRADALAIGPDDVATIIYTSGTTGEPKGAMLTHGNIASNVMSVISVIPMGPGDVSLSFLPLSHILERMFDYLMFAAGVSIAYVESIDTVLQNLNDVRPTIVVSVPRIYEKVYARVLENALSGSALKRRIFFWACATGERWADTKLTGASVGPWLGIKYRLADRLVFSKLRARVGGRIRYFVSGGAPLAAEINKFFYAAGLIILEGYGLTETSPVIAVNTPAHFRIGTVGQPIDGVEVRIAADGEILTRGPHVMKGYYNKPDATRDAIDADGWFRTGDIGVLEDGFLRITDRKKDIIVTAGGKNIAPQPIENQAKTNKYVAQAVMIGDRRKYPVMLVVPDFEQLEHWARTERITFSDRGHLVSLSAVRTKIESEVLAHLQGLAHFEMPKKVGIVGQDFTIESGELTPTLKVKRRVVDKKYKAMIDALYDDGAPAARKDGT